MMGKADKKELPLRRRQMFFRISQSLASSRTSTRASNLGFHLLSQEQQRNLV
jgi:hypothetical protein